MILSLRRVRNPPLNSWHARRLSALLTLCLMVAWMSISNGGRLQKPSFDGVTATFTLTRARITQNQKLEVRVVFRNETKETKDFRFYDFSVDASLYKNGEDLEILCPTGDNPVYFVTLKPGEAFEVTNELTVTQCYHLAPGMYSIRFNYNLALLGESGVRIQYEEKYRHPDAGVVPWDGRDHQFTVVE